VAELDKLLLMLNSPKASTRFDACEELRVGESIPEDAVAALKALLEDTDPTVADAARRALVTHGAIEDQGMAPPPPDTSSQATPVAPQHGKARRLASLSLGLSAGATAGFVFLFAVLKPWSDTLDFLVVFWLLMVSLAVCVLCPPLGFAFGIAARRAFVRSQRPKEDASIVTTTIVVGGILIVPDLRLVIYLLSTGGDLP
jgi:hypothetical protein